MGTLLNGMIYQNTSKFPKVPKWEGKLHFKKSRSITASEVRLIYIHNTDPVCNCEAFIMGSWIRRGHHMKYF